LLAKQRATAISTIPTRCELCCESECH
jgi:hypothetical protein